MIGIHATPLLLLPLILMPIISVPHEVRALDNVMAPTQGSHLDLQAQIKTTAAKVIPGVVNISSTVFVREQGIIDEGPLFGSLPLPPPHRQYGQGSGVIVTADGYIITNNHVVADAANVEVLLGDRPSSRAGSLRAIRRPTSPL